jgi:superfamily II DNA or RNA helicase
VSGSWFPLVEPATVRDYVGDSAMRRAGPYAQGAVRRLEWKAGTLEATVAGSEPRPYECWVTLIPGSDARYRPTASGCSCPVGTRCKHVAAAMLAARSRHGMSAQASDDGWRTALRTLTSAPEPWEPASDDRRNPLALLVEVRERVRRRSSGRWSHTTETTQAATAGSRGTVQLTTRIGSPGKRGWVGAKIGWGSLHYRSHEYGYDPAQVRWFVEFETLSRAAPGFYAGTDGSRLVLDGFASPLLWQLLDRAGELGIALVSGDKGGALALARTARLTTTVIAAEDGGLTLTPTVVVDDVERDVTAVRTIGDHGIAIVEWLGHDATGPVVTLAPLEKPLRADVLALARRGAIAVPASDVAEFTRDAYPSLARSMTLRAAPDAALPALEPPVLVLTVAFRAKQVVDLSWTWEYTAGTTVTMPALPKASDRARRDRQAEARTVAELTALLAEIETDGADADGVAADGADAARADPRGRGSGRPDAGPDPRDASSILASRTLRGIEAAEWVSRVLPALEAATADEQHAAGSMRVDIVGERVDYRELTEQPELTVTTVPTDQRDWFDLGVLVTVAGRTIPFEPLFRALVNGRKKLLLVDHSYLSLNQPVFERLKELLAEADALAEWETGPRISRYQAALWADFEDLADQSAPAVEWRETVSGLLAMTETSEARPSPPEGALVEREPLPAGLQAELRPYQRDGYDWLVFLWRHGLGGVLADDMGLGKTVQTLALIARARELPDGPNGPFLIVAPSSVAANWASEAARFTPGLRVASVAATGRKRGTPLADVIAGADIVLTTYTVFRLDHEEFAGRRWAGLVLDEAQFVKNHASQTHRRARELDAPFRLAVTGTPLENNLLELWAMFSIVAPGLFPSRRAFVEDYVKPIAAAASPVHGTDAAHGAARLARLRRRIRPLMLRRTKDVVAPELPQKQEQVLSIPLEPRHRRVYDTWLQRERQKVLGLLADLDRQRFIVYRSITLLRMLAVDASLIDPDNEGIPSSKLEVLIDQLGDVIAEGHRALVFSQFTSYLAKVAARLDAEGIAHAYLDGSTRKRSDVISGFREGDAPVFLISLKAGGFGLTLTEADYVFLLDPWWNPAAETQAIDRTHRIGQTKQVMVYRMVASDTIEEKVMRLGRAKAELFDAVLEDGGAFSSALSADDIRALLE